MKHPVLNTSVSLALGLVSALVLTWLLKGEEADPAIPLAHAAPVAAPADTYCVALEEGGPYPGCDQVFADIQDAADSASGGEVIKVAAGVYTSVQSHPAPPGYLFPPSSGLITQAVYIDRDVTVRGGYTITNGFADPPDATANPTTLDARHQGRVMFIASNIRPTVEGLRITNGNADGLGGHKSGDAGGGVYILSATATISNNSVFGNSADNGGGLFLYNSDATIINNKVVSNTVWHLGGGLSLERGNIRLSGNTISANIASTDGGGLHLHLGDVTLAGNAIVSNTAESGGGLCLEEVDNGTFSENTVAFNAADAGGGGLFAYDGSDFTSSGDIFFANTAGCCGGGMYLDEDTSATLSRSAVTSNTVGRFGGGLVLGEDTRVTLRQSTVARNTAAGDGGGLLVVDNYDATLVDNVITDNRAGIAGGGLHAAYFSHVTLNSNTVLSNSAQYGGGLSLSEIDQGTLTNNVVADNQAGIAGGGLYVYYSSSLDLLHTTIARNEGGDGSGLFVTGGGWPYRAVAMTNTILVGHTVGVTVTAGNTVTLQATLWGAGTWANEANWGGAGAVITDTVNIWGEPAFINPDTGDYRITSDSAAIDEGVYTGVRTDIEGQPRPLRAPDLGADEYWPPGTPKYIYLPLMLRNLCLDERSKK